MRSKFNYSDFQAELRDKNINVFISSSSFENRCFIIPRLVKEISKRSVIFYNGNEVPAIIENANSLSAFLRGAIEIELNSDEPVGNFIKIYEIVETIVEGSNKPNILIDITTFTHETLLTLLKVFELKQVFFGKLYLSYVGAGSYSFNELDPDKWLSKGIKSIRTVLGYSGFTDPFRQNHLVILFGFESERTKKLIDEYEYKYISLGFGKEDGSIQSDHQKLNYERHMKMLSEYPTAKAFTFSLVNPYETKADILQHLAKPEYENMNTVIAPLNNKLSTVGACLASIANQDIQLAYAKPLIYNTKGYSTPNEDIYFYQLIFS